MLDSRARFNQHEAAVDETLMVTNDYLGHAQEAFYDGPDTTGMLWLKHQIEDPANWHWFKRPMMYIEGALSTVWDNIIPLGLGFVTLTWMLDKSPLKVLGQAADITGHVLGGIGSMLKTVGGAAWDVMKPMLHIPGINNFTSRGVLATAAAVGMVLYSLGQFTKVLTGQQKDEDYNYFDPAALENVSGGH
jgi:hypothetical protein